jgi:membrane protein implicated in regulation of membrane protease activity
MASVIYTRCIYAAFNGDLAFDTLTFRVLLTTSAYTEDKDHDYRSEVTNEVANGNGYTTAGEVATVTVTLDDTNNRVDVSLGGASWASSSFTSRKAIYYVARGGASSADELVFCNDFGEDKTTSNGTLALSASTLRIQN